MSINSFENNIVSNDTIGINVVLVNEHDEPVGLAEKLFAHQQGLLHRAFSVFIVRKKNDDYEILLQQRAQHKYHCGGLWTNACCSHPYAKENIETAALRRLQEELGFSVPLQKVGTFIYHAKLDNDLIEHELDHVLIGVYNDDTEINFNTEEVMSYRWAALPKINQEITDTPTLFTPWLLPALALVEEFLRDNKKIS